VEWKGHTPLSDHLYEVLREPLRAFLPDDVRYQESFDRYEYLFALVHADLRQKQRDDVWGPVGCFGWRSGHRRDGGVIKQIELEAKDYGSNWPLLKSGFFEGSLERFLSIKTAFDERIAKLGWWW